MTKKSKKPGKQKPPAKTKVKKTVSQELSEQDLEHVTGGGVPVAEIYSSSMGFRKDLTFAPSVTLTTTTDLEAIGSILETKAIYEP